MNLIIVGTNCYDLGKEIWTANTEYAVVESNNINDKHYKAYIKDKKTITIADAEHNKDDIKERIMNDSLLSCRCITVPVVIAKSGQVVDIVFDD